MKIKTAAVVHYCDGCSKGYAQLDGDDLPTGFYVTVMDVHESGADGGNLFVCAEKCLLAAFKRRHDVWNPDR